MTDSQESMDRRERESRQKLVETLFSDDSKKFSGQFLPKVYKFHRNVDQINFQSQQKSAIALALHIKDVLASIDAEKTGQKLHRRIQIAIAGGGIAGVTLAAMLLVETELEITVFEKESDVLAHLALAEHRHIHPGINSWPSGQMNSGSILPHTTELPLLNWYADSCSNVVAKIIRQYKEIVSQYGITNSGEKRIHLETCTEYKGYEIDKEDKRIIINAISENTNRAEDLGKKYDILVISTGFGKEKKPIDDSSPGYWQPHLPPVPIKCALGTHPVHIVCGSGDGGLIDFILSAYGCDMQDIVRVAEEITKLIRRKHGTSFETELRRLTKAQQVIDAVEQDEIVSIIERFGEEKGQSELRELVLVTTSHQIRDSEKSALIHRVLAYIATRRRRAWNGNIINVYYNSVLEKKLGARKVPTYFIHDNADKSGGQDRTKIPISTSAIKITQRVGQELARSADENYMVEGYLTYTRERVFDYSVKLNEGMTCGDMRFSQLKKLADEAAAAWSQSRKGGHFYFNLIAENAGSHAPCRDVYFELVRRQYGPDDESINDFLLFNKRIFGIDVVDDMSGGLEMFDGD